MLQTLSICAARSADDRIQVWANAYDIGGSDGLLYTRWKGSGESAGWTPWQPFPGTSGQPGGGPATFYTWAAQLALPIPSPKPRGGGRGDGRLEVWGLLIQAPPTISTVIKSSTLPSAPWTLPWTEFAAPAGLQDGGIKQITTVPISDGRLQLFIVDQKNTIWTTVKVGIAWDAPWSDWTPFVTNGAPSGGLFNLTGARMLDGSVTLWALGPGNTIWSINRSAPSDASQFLLPNAGWGSWADFALQYGGSATSPPPAITNVKGIFAATGSSYTYLWAYGEIDGAPPQWYFTWTTLGSSPPLWGNGWLAFPIPPSEVTNFTSIAAGMLPEGGLQLFVLEIGKLGSNGYPLFTRIATAWQLLGGTAPNEWTFNNGHPWEDFSLS
jgi:hypothetical protein